MTPKVFTGLDALCQEDFSRLKGKSIALLANQATVNSRLEHILNLCLQSPNVALQKLFAPEHGFRGTAQDMESVEHLTDSETELPIISLYGESEESLRPRKEHLDDIDVVLVDLPDIGTRYYTFAQTLAYMMEVAGASGTKVLVLDRPNPINGNQVEGSPLELRCRSFCGLAPIPNRHGLTLGEHAKLFQSGFGSGEDALAPITCELEVITAKGLRRSMYFEETEVPWVAPSPNMPTIETAVVYPGTCLFEATAISEGRGTTKPFELLGAPYIDGAKWAKRTKEVFDFRGALLRPLTFVPQFQKHAGSYCGGLQIHVTDRSLFQPYRLGLALLYSLHQLYSEEFHWRQGSYEFREDIPAIDLLYGSANFRKVLDTEGDFSILLEELEAFENIYKGEQKELMLYS